MELMSTMLYFILKLEILINKKTKIPSNTIILKIFKMLRNLENSKNIENAKNMESVENLESFENIESVENMESACLTIGIVSICIGGEIH